MRRNHAGSVASQGVLIRAQPVQLAAQRQLENWHSFLADFISCICKNDSVIVLYRDSYDLVVPIPHVEEVTMRDAEGVNYRSYEVPGMTKQIIRQYIVEADEFSRNIDLFVWKPRTGVNYLHIYEIMNWRNLMFDQFVPFSVILSTDKCIGFPSEDGNCFYWANPDVPLIDLEAIANEHNVLVKTSAWNV